MQLPFLDDLCLSDINDAEREVLKTFLNLTVENISPNGDFPKDAVKAEALRTAIQYLAKLQPHRDKLTPNGVIWYGRPRFLTDQLLRQLQDEANLRRAEAIMQNGNQYVGKGGPFVDQFAMSRELSSFVEGLAGPILRTGIASYLYYETPGACIVPHVDTKIFSLNANLMLKHDYLSEPSSCLFLFPPDGEPERFFLKPGEILLMYADSIVHGRAPLGKDESVCTVTIGFQPKRIGFQPKRAD